MKTIAHISDLHFGAEDAEIARGLAEDLNRLAPTLLVVSGDLTQRAETKQFVAARNYLDQLPAPQLIVPGNHDIPLFDIFRRMLRPLARYRRHVTADLSPCYRDAELVVQGVNTARSSTWKNGRISRGQIRHLRQSFTEVESGALKVLVTHHPFVPARNDPEAAVVGRGELALKALEECDCSLLLSGHLHMADSSDIRAVRIECERSMLVIQAGTAISHRRRGEPNSYNVIQYDAPHLTIEVRTWLDAAGRASFQPTLRTRYTHHERHGWTVIPEAAGI